MKSYTLGLQSRQTTTSTTKRSVTVFLLLVTPLSSEAANPAHWVSEVGLPLRRSLCGKDAKLGGAIPRGFGSWRAWLRSLNDISSVQIHLFSPEAMRSPDGSESTRRLCWTLHWRKKQVLSSPWNGDTRRALNTAPELEAYAVAVKADGASLCLTLHVNLMTYGREDPVTAS